MWVHQDPTNVGTPRSNQCGYTKPNQWGYTETQPKWVQQIQTLCRGSGPANIKPMDIISHMYCYNIMEFICNVNKLPCANPLISSGSVDNQHYFIHSLTKMKVEIMQVENFDNWYLKSSSPSGTSGHYTTACYITRRKNFQRCRPYIWIK